MRTTLTSYTRTAWLVTLSCCIFNQVFAAEQPESIPATPIKLSSSNYRVTAQACHLVMDINPQIGGRIAQLRFEDKQIITPYACGNAVYAPLATCNGSGSTFWTSPQTAWANNGWPPVTSIDGDAYSARVKHTHLLMTGSNDAILGTRINKDFSIDSKHCTVNLRYTINAIKDLNVAPWEITRVPRGGIAFFPLGEKSKLNAGPLAPYTTIADNPGIVWFNDINNVAPASDDGAKLIADGKEGWLAYAHGDTLFIKAFADVPVTAIAPGEGDIEIYSGGDYLELEAQGSYTSLNRGNTVPWLVQWRVVKIPSAIKVEMGSASLVAFAREQLSMPP